jgi:N-acetylmuramoyl-L-alanine amidase
MSKFLVLILFLIILISGCGVKQVTRFEELPSRPIQQIPNEMRGVWITRFAYANPDPDSMRSRIVTLIEEAASANFNAIFFQVRGQAETLYPSPYEPWSKLVDNRDPGFDPVRLAVSEAHQQGLKFYAYINLLPLWNGDEPPADSSHLYFKHGPEVNTDSSWVCFDETGKPMQKNEYYYLNPALPQVKTYLKKVIHQFVETYDIDGLHFDRIRYPGSQYVNDPYSLKMFRSDSLQTPTTKGQWARKQLSDLVEDVVIEAMLIKPYLVNSAATWGLYRTDDVKGYEQFGSGYAVYYQDAIDWLDRGIMDFIVPMIYWDIPNPLPNFDDLWLDFKKRTPNYKYIFPGLRVRSKLIDNGEISRQVNFVRQNGGLGTVMFDIGSLEEGNGLTVIKNILYPSNVDVPPNLKRLKPEQIVQLDMRDFFADEPAGREVEIPLTKQEKLTDSQGKAGFILPHLPDTLTIKTNKGLIPLNTYWWRPPYNYLVQKDSTVSKGSPWVEFREMPDDTTLKSKIYLLCKTDYPAKAWIDSDTMKVYKTGIFFKAIDLNEGRNRISAKIIRPDSSFAMYEREFVYKKVDKTRKPFPLWIDEKSIEPAEDVMVLPEDMVRISFNGSKGQDALAEIKSSNVKIAFSRMDFSDYSRYEADLPLRLLKRGEKHQVKLILKSALEDHKKDKYEQTLKVSIEVKYPDEFPLLETTRHNSLLHYSLGEIRLGPPIITEYEPGVVLKSTGRIGENYRIQLDRNTEGYIHQYYVEELPKEAVQPSYYVNSITCTPSDTGDIVRIPYPEPVPYAIYPQPEQKRIIIALYGVKTSSTWIIHRKDRRVIKNVTWRQSTPETYQVIVNLKTEKIWGYDLKQEVNTLLFRVKYPPVISNKNGKNNLTGLKLAIEAGHGGFNIGAESLSGIPEKDINLDLAKRLARICRENGVEILQVRDRDKYISLTTKRDTVLNSNADLLISIHANAGASGRWYLDKGGTSTYYNNPFWGKFAEIIYGKLLESGLDEFGFVGSFNYIVIRVHSRPTILVEQAFLDNAIDEEKLASEEFRQNMAQKIYEGIVEFVNYMRAN